ncbi:(d)CMP kinase [Acidiplasma sp.]|uniref:(d)CMP kinase n=1 Tax=Acidiplasma sp. TaxID=1872114 RepID=UPI003164C78E
MIVTISGESGSGKTTVGKLLADKLNYRFYSGGYFFRKKAEEYHMSLIEFSKYAEENKNIDMEEDNSILNFMRENDNIIIESRLCGYLSKHNNIDALRIFLEADEETRISRIYSRDNNAGRSSIICRERSELRRYMTFYGIDYRNYIYYDYIIKTELYQPEDIVNYIYSIINK